MALTSTRLLQDSLQREIAEDERARRVVPAFQTEHFRGFEQADGSYRVEIASARFAGIPCWRDVGTVRNYSMLGRLINEMADRLTLADSPLKHDQTPRERES